jgi:hypothetical protein
MTMGSELGRRRWLWRLLIALGLAAAAMVLGACASVMYVHTLWEAGNYRCGTQITAEAYSGWGISFNGRTDAFVCTVRDDKFHVVARKEIPVGEVMGASGGWPFFPDLIAHELEAVDGDAP